MLRSDDSTLGEYAGIHVQAAGDDDALADTLVALAGQIAAALDCGLCCIYEHVPDEQALRAQAIWSRQLTQRDREWIGRIAHRDDCPGFERVVTRREVVLCNNDETDGSDADSRGSMPHEGGRAAMWAPIVHNDEVLGVLELTERERLRSFSADDERLVHQMASLAAIALRNARVSRAAEERNRQLAALIDSSRAMTSSLDLDEVLQIVCHQAALALGAVSSSIYSYEPATETMVWLAQYHRDPDHGCDDPLGTVYPIRGLPRDLAMVRTRRPHQARLDDPNLDDVSRQQLLRWRQQASLMVPLVVGDTVVGALEVSEPHRSRHFTEQEIALCVALGEQAAAAIHNAQLYGRVLEQKAMIELQATTDGLTGLHNHRHFWECLRHEVARAKRYGQPLSLLMLDLDGFKAVNDRYGHLAGDQVLNALGDVLRAQVRQGIDAPARYGGEEFTVVLPCTDSRLDETGTLDGAVTAAQRIRQAIADLRVPLEGDATATITVSIGVATLPDHAADAEDLVSKADQALYLAKRRGKNRVEAYVSPRQ